MKLSTLRRGGRDGTLVVVSRDLARCCEVGDIAATLQHALDRWDQLEPQLRAVSDQLNESSAGGGNLTGVTPFDPEHCAAPMPRAYQWVDGSAYVNHVELVRKARGATMPESFWTDPLVYQGGSDNLLGPRDDVPFPSEEFGIDLEAEVAIITGDTPMGTASVAADRYIRLLTIVNDWSLRNLIPGELAKGFGFYQSKPATSFAPVVVTPDELGAQWRDFRIHRPLVSHINNRLLGQPNAGVDMTFGFDRLLEHIARTRKLGAGTIVGSSTVSNYDRSQGSSCLAEVRTLEQIEHGAAQTAFLRFGDHVRIEMLDDSGRSIFGALDNRVVCST